MSWITPKTNWYSGNYYNLEDAQRIADNICYLLEKARTIYSGNITCLINRQKNTGSRSIFYGVLQNVNVANMTVYDSSKYSRSMTNWLSYDAQNFKTLVYLMMLSYQSAPAEPGTGIGRYVSYDTSSYDSHYLYWEPCIIADSASSSSFNYKSNNPLYALWEPQSSAISGTSDKIPVYSAWYSGSLPSPYGSGCCLVSMSSDATICYGKIFWNYKYLNAIEQTISNVRTRLNRY
jgi:hypothetical protein